jgi:hypothetical protein
MEIREIAEVSAVPLKQHQPADPSTVEIVSTTGKAVIGSNSGPPRTLGTYSPKSPFSAIASAKSAGNWHSESIRLRFSLILGSIDFAALSMSSAICLFLWIKTGESKLGAYGRKSGLFD